MDNESKGKIIEIKGARLSMEEDGILRMNVDYRNAITIKDIKDLHAATIKISGGSKTAVLVKRTDFTGYKGISRDARAYAAGEEGMKVFKAVAILIANSVMRMSANFFIKLNRPPFPIRMFTSENEALVWLRGFLT
jgi:hypothetical protein